VALKRELTPRRAANFQLCLVRLKRRYAQRMRQGRKVLLTAVFAVLIVVNVVLLFLLVRSDRVLTARPSDQDSGGGDSPTATSSPAPDASTNLTPSSRPIVSVPAERLLFKVSSKTAWRATVGDCETPGKIERSTNDGASWKRIAATGPAPIVQLGALPSGDLFTIGGGGHRCSVRYASYANDGTVTASTTSPINVWFPTPKDRDEINGPGGTRATPCSGHAIGFAPLNVSRALIVCDNGTAMSTGNAGKTWWPAARIPNTLAITAASGRYWVARGHDDCDGVTVQALTEMNGSLTGGRTRCASGLDVAAGKVAIAVSGGTIWLWSGNRVAISTNEGETWK
jgi:hypothetical protein